MNLAISKNLNNHFFYNLLVLNGVFWSFVFCCSNFPHGLSQFIWVLAFWLLSLLRSFALSYWLPTISWWLVEKHEIKQTTKSDPSLQISRCSVREQFSLWTEPFGKILLPFLNSASGNEHNHNHLPTPTQMRPSSSKSWNDLSFLTQAPLYNWKQN